MQVKNMFCSIPLIVAGVFLSTGWLLNVFSYFIPYWNRIETTNWGLWHYCTKLEGCGTLPTNVVTEEMQLGRVVLTVAFISHTALVVQVALYIWWKQHIHFLSSAAWTSFATMVLLFVGALCWMSAGNTSLSWCYYMCYVSGVMTSASGGVLLHLRRQERLKDVEIQEQVGT